MRAPWPHSHDHRRHARALMLAPASLCVPHLGSSMASYLSSLLTAMSSSFSYRSKHCAGVRPTMGAIVRHWVGMSLAKCSSFSSSSRVHSVFLMLGSSHSNLIVRWAWHCSQTRLQQPTGGQHSRRRRHTRCARALHGTAGHTMQSSCMGHEAYQRALHCLADFRTSSEEIRAHWLSPYFITAALRISSCDQHKCLGEHCREYGSARAA